MHFHGVHSAFMDGMPGIGEAAGGGHDRSRARASTTSSTPSPFGMHLYHCHVAPLAAHIAKGLYGAFIIDPQAGRAGGRRDGDGDERLRHQLRLRATRSTPSTRSASTTSDDPIRVKRDELVRIYLANLVEYDPINSFHIHGNFFDYFPTGTSLEPSEFTDTSSRARRSAGSSSCASRTPGRYMFHAHKTEFAELGWIGFFEVS